MTNELPTGTITFLLTDIEDSTKLWEKDPDAVMQALARHDQIIESAVSDNHGVVVKPRGEGDSRFAVFEQAKDAVSAAARIQIMFHAEAWQTPTPLKVRMSLHTGEANLRMGDYYGSVVNRAARLRSIGYGGQTLLSAVTRELVKETLPPGVILADQGEHRLKDLSREEHVYQLVIDDVPTNFPPLKSLSVIPNNLPAQLTDFIGRESELEEIHQLLEKTRLLTLVGPGGTGKTRLALEVAADQAENFKHGVFFVPLAPLHSSDFMVQAVAESIGLSLSTDEQPLMQLNNYLRNKQMFILLDNFEHVMDSKTIVREILENAPRVTILATSRERLNILGETVFNTHGLEYSDFKSLDQALASTAVQLFLQSARQVSSDYALKEEDLPHLARILTMVQGIPLGILLSAAWLDMMPLREIADEISDSFDFLETEMEGLPQRQRSMRAVFEYSWNLLGDDDKELFKRLSIFRGGFNRDAAKQVAGASVRSLMSLTNKSLLISNPDTGRFLAQGLLRQFAAEQFEQDAEAYAETCRKHADNYVDFMQAAWDKINTQKQREGLEEIEVDIENVRAAWRYIVGNRQYEDINRFIRPWWLIHEVRGWYLAGENLFREAASSLAGQDSGEAAQIARAQVISAQGWFLGLLSRPGDGVVLAQEGIETLRKIEKMEEALIPINAYSICSFFTNHADQSLEISLEGLEISKRLNDPWWMGLSNSWIGSAALAQGRFEDAVQLAGANFEIVEKLGNYWCLTWPGQVLGGIAMRQGDLEKARDRYTRVLNAIKTIGFQRGIQYIYNQLGEVELLADDLDKARENFIRSLKVSDEIGQVREMLGTITDYSKVLRKQGKEPEAVKLLATVLNHPANAQFGLFRSESLHDEAEHLRAGLEGSMDADAYASAWKEGASRPLDQVVAELLENQD
jgi:predicted ATPase/class 3 adenylate cyclase